MSDQAVGDCRPAGVGWITPILTYLGRARSSGTRTHAHRAQQPRSAILATGSQTGTSCAQFSVVSLPLSL